LLQNQIKTVDDLFFLIAKYKVTVEKNYLRIVFIKVSCTKIMIFLLTKFVFSKYLLHIKTM